MQAMRDVLITSADGAPSQRHRLVASTDWDEVQHWCRQIYLPYDAKPAGPASPTRCWTPCRSGSSRSAGSATACRCT